MTKIPTPESILENYEPNREYDSYYHENNIIEAMHTYASLMLDELARRIKESCVTNPFVIHAIDVELEELKSETRNTNG